MPRTPKQSKQNAAANLRTAGIDLTGDFHALHSSDVDRILAEAVKCQYRKPTNANGSRARYFFYSLQRAKA